MSAQSTVFSDVTAHSASHEAALRPWMKFLLRFAALYNLAAGANMLLFTDEGFKFLEMTLPTPTWPTQLLGLLVALFGIGYWMVASRPVQNRDLLLLGFWSKLLGSALSLYHWRVGNVPYQFVLLVVVSDMIYLPPFWIILRHLKARSQQLGALAR
jgi:small multidrug resistance pump